jgi:phosphatidate cytidylyltransferase
MVGPQLSGTARRFLGVLVLIPIITAVWFDIKIASIVVAILAVGMAYEFSKMLKMPVIAAIGLTLLIALQSLPVWLFDAGPVWHSGLALLSFGIAMMYRGVLAGLFALALAICLYFSALLLDQPDGHWLLLVLAAVVAACDSAAYFVGRSVGGVKLAPLVSPNKTVSGSVGGIVAAVAVMAGFASIPALAPITGLDVVTALVLGCGVAVLSQIGDLLESALKRRLNVKDSGAILPGHGGLLDRFDGYLFTVPGVYLFFFAS